MKRAACAFVVLACAPRATVTIEARTPATQADVHRAPELDGAELARRFACTTCHDVDKRLVGPGWRGLYGTRVALAGDRAVIADEAYIVRSIFDPRADLVEGFPPVMPSFRGTLDDEHARAIAAYIRGLR